MVIFFRMCSNALAFKRILGSAPYFSYASVTSFALSTLNVGFAAACCLFNLSTLDVIMAKYLLNLTRLPLHCSLQWSIHFRTKANF